MRPFRESAPNRYSRLFPPAQLPSAVNGHREALSALGCAMIDDGSRVSEERPEILIDCGYTYFGQFIAHDLTKDVTTLDEAWGKDPEEIENLQTPHLNLDSLYGGGPEKSPALYEKDGLRLRVGSSNGSEVSFDVCVGREGERLLADDRAAGNLILRQITAVFARLHNFAVEQVRSRFADRKRLFERAQQLTRWQFQYLVANDYLPMVLNVDVYREIFHQGRTRIGWGAFSVPIEFAVAAMRFGHSMVRPNYLFAFSRDLLLPKILGRTLDRGPLGNDFRINWGFFFQGAGEGGAVTARPIDTRVSAPLHELPDDLIGVAQIACPHFQIARNPDQLPVRTLLRGAGLRLASGQAAAAALNEPPLTDSELTQNSLGEETAQGTILRQSGLIHETPLWYYILKESETDENGNRVGRLGSRLIAETIYAALRTDPDSILSRTDTDHEPPIWNFPDGRARIYGLTEFFRRASSF